MLRVLLSLGLALAVIGGYFFWTVAATDPYASLSQVESPFVTSVNDDGVITLEQRFTPELQTDWLSRSIALARTGARIVWYSLFVKEKPLAGNEQQIIDQIHAQRFNPDRPYVITGGHYSDLYVRNLGVFYNALLDPRLSNNATDWQNRQRIAVQTVAYDLAFLQQNQVGVTTIAPSGPRSYVGLNIYSPPSDALFGILYTLKALQTPDMIVSLWPTAAATSSAQVLQTGPVARQLLDEHQDTLSTALNQYLADNLDPSTGLIREEITLSSARDGISRQSSFYDNVIAWSTVQLADDLGIPHSPVPEKDTWKQLLMAYFWDEELGIFKNDRSHGPTTFSADALIVTSTGFFDLQDSGDLEKLDRIVQYIQKEKLDQPFPLRYSRSNTTNQMHLTVRWFAPSYMGDGIWSHWGMEYIKALGLLAKEKPEYGVQARHFLDVYQENIKKYDGYPELYAADGRLFSSPLLRSVLHSGWVVNYEQAQLLVP